MKMSWGDYIAIHAPYVAMGVIALLSAVYSFGYESGKRSILFAASRADIEAKGGIIG